MNLQSTWYSEEQPRAVLALVKRERRHYEDSLQISVLLVVLEHPEAVICLSLPAAAALFLHTARDV